MRRKRSFLLGLQERMRGDRINKEKYEETKEILHCRPNEQV